MDADRRARILALLDTAPIGVATLSALVRQLIADLDIMTAERDQWRTTAMTAGQRTLAAEAGEATAKTNASRLAQWIIAHPNGVEAERTELLNMHDRAQ